jgi:phage tail-like protein
MGIPENVGKALGDKVASDAMKKAGDLGGSLLGEVGGKLASQVAGQAAGMLLGALFGRADPDVGFAFYVEIDGIRCVKFREAHGLEWKSEVESFYEGGNHRHKVNLVGKGTFSPLVLKKGFFAASGEFYRWFDTVMGKGSVQRVTVSIVSLNGAGEEVGRFNFFGAFMSKYTGPTFNATDSSLAFEEIEITYDYFEFVPGGAIAGALQSGMAALGKML